MELCAHILATKPSFRMRHTLQMMPLTFSEKHDLTAEIKLVFFFFWAYVSQEDEFLNLLETRQIEEIFSVYLVLMYRVSHIEKFLLN